jgi:hypothetical protein
MEIVVTEEGKKLPGAEVKLFRNGSLVETFTTDGKGGVDVPLDPNGNYTLEIGGNNGMIKKKLDVNTNNVPPETAKGDNYFPAEVDIFKKIDGLDYKILDEPIGKIRFDEGTGGFDVDLDYTKRQKAALDKLQKDFLAQKAKEAANEKERQKEYEAAIKIADKAFADEDWEKAEQEYKRAEGLMPLETYPSFQLAELKSKLIELRETNKRYDEAIGKAEAAVSSNNFEVAIAEFKRASGYKPNEEYPKNKVKELQSQLANQAKVEQEYLAAIEKGDNALKINDLNSAKAAFEEATAVKPSEAYPKNKLAEINDILSKQQAKEEEYNTAIKEGDEALAAKSYEKAKAAYQKASSVKPTETYPKEQITKVDGLLAEAAKKEQNYLAAVERGDQALAANKLEEAKAAFEEASGVKPSEEYPKNKIKEIEQFIAEKAAKEEQYQAKVKEADKALAAQDYETAKTAYEAASALKPVEAYPKEKIKEIEGILAANAEKEANYKAAIAKGDKALGAEDYTAAKTAYNEALGLKPNEKYPQDKLDEIKGIVVKQQQLEEEYKKAVQDGDDALADKAYEKAKDFYQQALSLKAGESYPKQKLQEIEGILAKAAEQEAAYTAAIEKGDKAMGAEDWEAAKTAYTEAIAIKQDNYPQEKLKEIETKLAALAAEKEAAAKLEADYQAAIQKGDKALSNKEYQMAIAAYQEAQTLKSEEAYPKEKISEIEGILKEQEEQEKAYAAAIQKADQAFAKEEWTAASAAYNEAIAIKADPYPQDKLKEIETKLAAIEAEKAAAAKLDADYQAAIAEGDKKLGEQKYDEAISAFNKALELKASEKYPLDKIAEIKAVQEKLAAEKAEKERMEALQKEYDGLIAKADESMKAEALEEARKLYQDALALKAEEQYPKTKIEEINGILSDAAEQEQAYQEAIGEANKLFAAENWEEAKKQYATASSIKSGEDYPKEKIKEIEGKLATLAAEQEEIRLRNEKEAAIDAQYEGLVKEADELFNASEWKAAKTKYNEALKLKEEQYPKDQLSAIEAAIQAELEKADAEAAAKAKAEKEAALNAQYEELVKAADEQFNASEWEAAKAKYNEALQLKDEQYPKDQLSAIENAIQAELEKADAAAAARAKAEKEAAYQETIAAADALFGEKKLEEAKSKYKEALTIKDEEYPTQKISEINDLLVQQAEKEAANRAAEEEAKITAKYQELVAAADELFEQKQYDQSKAKYEEALSVKDESYPKERVKEILAKQQELLNKEEEAARLAKLQMDYHAAVENADKALTAGKLEEALKFYREASSLKPSEAYPKNKIEEINGSLASKAEAAAAEEAEREASYQEAIQLADAAFEQKQFEEAIANYKKAQGVKPGESYPQQKLNEIASILANKAAKEEEIRLQKEREAKNEMAYQTAITNADKYFAGEKWMEAENEYELALGLKPSATYPQEQLDKIAKRLEQQRLKEQQAANAARKEEEFKEHMAAALEALETSSYHLAKREYELALGIKPSDEYAQRQLDKVKAILEKKKEEELTARKAEIKEEKPITIQKGPKATVDVSVEEEIERMYKEIWAKKNSEKNEMVEEKQELVRKLREEKEEKENSKRQNALEEIEAISISMQEQNEMSGELNLQNYETVKQKTESIREAEMERVVNAERNRETEFAEEKELEENIREFNRDRNTELVEGKKEMVENEYEEIRTTTQRYEKDQADKRESLNDEYVMKEETIREWSQERSSANLEDNVNYIGEVENNWKETLDTYNSEATERRTEEQQKVGQQQIEEQQFRQSRQEHFKENQQVIEEKVKALKEESDELNMESEKRRQDNASEEFYEGEDRPRQDPRASEFRQGVTEEIIENQNNSTTIRRTVVEGTEVDVYEKTFFSWGGVFYTKNGNNITEETWDAESK